MSNGRDRTMASTRSIWADDNLSAMASMPAGCATLAYLDPPFNSGRSYEALLGVESSSGSREAFTDLWSWSDEAESHLAQLEEWVPNSAASLVRSLVAVLGRDDLAAYLAMMTPRMGALHRVLADNGSLYLHCDPAASHYLKIVLDQIFGAQNFRNEIVWKRTHAHSGSRRFGPVHDVILFYSKTAGYVWNQGFSPYSDEYVDKYFRNHDERGAYQLITCTAPGSRVGTRAHYRWRGVWPPANRHWAWTEDVMEQLELDDRLVYSSTGTPRLKRYVDDGEGVRIQDLWLDINPLSAHSAERTGYETQKPSQLLRRIVESSSNPGDLVLDPFSGTGTTAVAAEELGRSWAAVDVSLLAASLTLARVRSTGTDAPVELYGFPRTLGGIRDLRRCDPMTFAVWATGMLGTLIERDSLGTPLAKGTGKLGAEGGAKRSIVSWVPLSPGGSALKDLGLYRSSADLGMLLVGSRSDAELCEWVRSGVSRRIQAVELESLVSREAATAGMAPALTLT